MNISLIGFRGVGKSTLGKLLARKLAMNFIDIDQEIESKIGMSICKYFDENNECAFRRIESSTITEVLRNSQNTVISCGGGSILAVKNIFEIKSNSKVIFLDAKKNMLFQRLSNSKRPALTSLTLENEIECLLQQRNPLYHQCADVIVEVFNRSNKKNLQAIENALEGLNANFPQKKIHFEGQELQSYDIEIRRGLAKRIVSTLDKKLKYLIICDTNIEKLYAIDFKEQLKREGIACGIVSFPAGEESKNLVTFAKIHEQIDHSFDRSSCILALGGGVTGDIGGFVASTFLRGIPFIQIPTSLLSMVDSSIGGKLGVNTSKGKNLIGIFNSPRQSTSILYSFTLYREGYLLKV